MNQVAHPSGKIQVDPDSIPNPPRSLMAYVSKLLSKEYNGAQRRSSKRLPVIVPVVAVPLDTEFQPNGTNFAAISADLSTTGLRLFATQAVASKFLAVTLMPPAGQNIQVVVRVLRCTVVSRFYEIAGQLVVRMDDQDS